ncbi:MAG: enolase C-terminal domain-like protein, partial [Chloroflexota bacterium]
VKVRLPTPAVTTPARRASSKSYAPRALPISKYPDWPPGLPSDSPGFGGWTVWVQATAEDGTWGLGRCTFGEPVAALVDHHFAPLLAGRDCFAHEYLSDLMWRSSLRHGAQGLNAVAMSGVDLALWDLKGKLLGQPVYRLLGGPARDKIRCYCTTDDLDWSIELGFTAFKIMNPVHYEQGIAGINIVEDKIAKARETVGRGAELMYNPVMAFDVEFAIRLAERLRPYELRWMEEPLIPDDLEGHAQLARAVTWIPIATGEDHHTRWAFRPLVEHRCVAVVQPDLHWCGGLTEAVRIYHIAEAAGIKTILHGGANSPEGQHFSLAFPEAPMAEFSCKSPVGVPLAEANTLPGMPVPKDGFVRPSDAPGFGLDVKEEWIAPWR